MTAIIMTAMAVSVFAEGENTSGETRLLLEEDFAGFTSAKNKDVSKELDKYTHTPDWLGLRIYGNGAEGGMIKIGTTSDDGLIITPPVTPTLGSLTIYVEAAPYKEGTTDYMLVSLADSETADYMTAPPNNTMIVKDFNIDSDYTPAVISLSLPTPQGLQPITSCRVRIDPNKVAYLRCIRIYDGILSSDDITTSISQSRPVDRHYSCTFTIGGMPVPDGSSGKGIYIKDGRKILTQ